MAGEDGAATGLEGDGKGTRKLRSANKEAGTGGKGREMMGKALGREGEDRAHDGHGKAAQGQHICGRGRESSGRGGKGCEVMGRGGAVNERAAKPWRGIWRNRIGKESAGRGTGPTGTEMGTGTGRQRSGSIEVGGGREVSGRGGKGCEVMGWGGVENARAAKPWRSI